MAPVAILLYIIAIIYGKAIKKKENSKNKCSGNCSMPYEGANNLFQLIN
jgi:hypothetical protein